MPSAEELVQAIRQAHARGEAVGDLETQLWATGLEVIEALAKRYTRARPQDRDDFLGEAYLKFRQVLKSFDPLRGVPFRAYLAGCVEHHFHDQVRKRRDRSMMPPTGLPAPGLDLLVALRDREIADRVEEVVDTLLPDDRARDGKIAAFKLRHFEGWTVERIRDRLGVANANTVSQWIHRVRRAFEREFPRRFPEYFAERIDQEGLQLLD